MVQDNITHYINNIIELLVAHEEMVKLDAKGNLLNRAVLSEIFYCDFLNVLMGWDLKNANLERKNAPGIDLIDAERKIAVQVSLTCDHEKIQSSIDKFDKNWSRGSSVWHFYFVPLTEKVPDYRVDFAVPSGIEFDKKMDVLTKTRIKKLAETPLHGELNVDRLQRVSSTLDRLMREQEDHDEVCSYLLEVLEKKRASHPSFTLLGTDDIDVRLFPGIEESKDMPAVGEKEGVVAPIWDLIEEEQKEGFRHIVIEGVGGIGKSVSLLSVTDKKELLKCIPAIYIHMYDLVSDGKCSTISEHIHKYYAHTDKIEHLASKDGKPKLMVLLDGLNEVASDLQSKLMKDIGEWANSNPGVRLIIASRPIPGRQLENMLGREVSFIRLKQLEWSHVEQYLESRHIPIPEEKSKLGETVKLPLFLTLYAKTAKLDGKKVFGECPLHVREAVGPASLIWNYLQREALRQQTENDVITCVLSCELISPYVAYRMAANHMFEAGEKIATKLVCEAVDSMNDSIDQDRLPKHVSTAWTWFGKKTHSQSLPSDANWPTRVLDECGVFVPPVKKSEATTNGGKRLEAADYAFLHQNFRDCLAALHLVNAAETANEELPKEWKKSIRHEVLEYAAELMDKPTAAKLWELNRTYMQYTGKKQKNNVSTYMQLELNRLLGTPGDSLDFSCMDLRGTSLTNYMGLSYDLRLFGKPELAKDTHIDRKTFESAAGHTDWVTCLSVLSDGRIVSGSEDHTLRIWNADTGECLQVLEGHTDWVRSLATLPDGRIVSGSKDATIHVWNPDTGECLRTLKGHTDCISSLAVLSNGHIVSGSVDKTIRIWDTDTGECLRTLEGHADSVNCLAILPDGQIVSGSDDKTICIWDADTGKCLQSIKKHTGWITCLAVFPDGRIVSGSGDDTIRIWDTYSGDCLHVLEERTDRVRCLAVLHDGHIVSGSVDGALFIWNADNGECLRELEGHTSKVGCLAVLPSGYIVSGSYDKTIRIWDTDTGECLRTLEGHSGAVRCLAVLPDGRLVSGLHDNTLRIWNADTGECLQTLKGHTDLVRCLTVLSDSRIVSGAYDATLRIWNVNTGKWQPLEGHSYAINCLTVFRDKRIVGGSYDATLRIWNADTCEYIGSLEGHTDWLRCLAVLSDERIISGSRDTTIRVWDPDTRECLRTLTGHTDSVNCLAILPDGRIVSGSSDETIRIWKADTGDCLKQIKTRTGWRRWCFLLLNVVFGEELAKNIVKGAGSINCLVLLHDKHIVSGSDDGIVRVWDPDTGKCLQKLKGHTGLVNCLAVLQNGYIVSGSDDSTIRIWDADTGKCLDILEAAEVDVSNMFFSNAVMDEDTIRILYQNMAQDHGEFAKMYRRTGGDK